MLLTIGEFCTQVQFGINDLIDELVSVTGRSGDNERMAWAASLPRLSNVLAKTNLDDVQLFIPPNGNVIVEYRLPASSSWCDMVLLGRNEDDRRSVLIIELKHWQTSEDTAGPCETLINHNGILHLHPSDQVRGYSEYCERFHSTVQEYSAQVSGCVYFSNDSDISAYKSSPHHYLVQNYPVFNYSKNENTFHKYIKEKINKSDNQFASDFIKGQYKQDRNLLKLVADNLCNNSSPFVLLDEQRKGFELALAKMESNSEFDEKKVIIIKGPPGSGKSAIAANLWVEAAKKFEGNIVFVTTSSSQKTNWQALFETYGTNRNARHLVLPANVYQVGMWVNWVVSERNLGYNLTVESWRENLVHYKARRPNNIKTPDDAHFISIVDEAHALMDPSKPEVKGAPPSGYCIHAGPQVYHIIRASKNSIFLLDNEQSYRDNESTIIPDIVKYAEEFNAEVSLVDLTGSQFRCGGSVDYIDWVEHLFDINITKPNLEWRKSDSENIKPFSFELVENPLELEHKLRDHVKQNLKVRLASSYSKEWKTQNESNPHQLPDEQKDFYYKFSVGNKEIIWGKIWNYAPAQDYTLFIQAPFGSHMYDDPLCEVGCPYVLRGFDYDYLGIIWGKDLVWRNGKWIVQIENIYEESIKKTIKKYRDGQDLESLPLRIKRAYRILFTRAFKGVYVWIEDQETREYVNSLLS